MGAMAVVGPLVAASTAAVVLLGATGDPPLQEVGGSLDRPAARAGLAAWAPPLEGARVIEGFRVGPLPWSPGHRGVDLESAGPVPARVLAPAGGRIVFAGRVVGTDVVVVAHADGLRSTLMPVRASRAVGESVAGGQEVGRVAGPPQGASAAHLNCPRVGACVHWGVLRGSTYLDPLALLGGRLVRLVPFSGSG